MDTVKWLDLTQDYGLPAPIMMVLAGEPLREISVEMRYADLLFIKQLLDKHLREIVEIITVTGGTNE